MFFTVKEKVMSTLSDRRRPHVRAFITGFQRGLGDVVSIGAPPRRHVIRIETDSAKALKGDWDRLGADMRGAVDTVMTRGARR